MKDDDTVMTEWKIELRRAKSQAAIFFLILFALVAAELYVLGQRPLTPALWLAVVGASLAGSLPFYLHARSRKPR